MTRPRDPLILRNRRTAPRTASEDRGIEVEALHLTTVTIHEALRRAAARISETGSDEAALEAEILLMHATGLDRAGLYERLTDELPPAQAEAFAACVGRRLSCEPVPYITGHKEFFALDFEITPAALIPRPETETLVELAVAFARRRFGDAPCAIADVGTGSGIIAISLAHALPNAIVTATDMSSEALALARRNANRHAVAHRITFVHADLLAQPGGSKGHPDPVAQGPGPERAPGPPFDFIAANLPYVATSDWEALPSEIRDHEPRAALDGGPDGLRVIERLLAAAAAYLRPGGALFEEIGDRQGPDALRLARRYFPGANITIEPDLAARDRVLAIRL